MNYINKHYTKMWVAAILLLLAGSGAATAFYINNSDYRLSIIAYIAIAAALLLIVKLIRHPIKIAHRFADCISAKEHNSYFIGNNDLLLGALGEKMNDALQKSSREREALERTRAYNERIMRVMSHELRNSLAPIISLSAHNGTVEENIAENMQIIHSQAVAVNDFVNAFHRLSNIPAPKIADVNASALFKRLAHLLRDEKGRCSLQFTAPQELVIKADANQLILVLVNLLRNSFHALDGQQNGKIEVLASSSEGKKYITVRDNGPGIADEHIEHIFEPFYSTKNGGTGIGLPLSRQIMFLHGGDLKVLSTRAGNTIFILQF
ncbi:MAG: HAMP domain-containing histidine kinase [Bacteroidaceae bacterium]|nr:HAMP domain-containing histidine kinase [Bacteroidaceae bacterium]